MMITVVLTICLIIAMLMLYTHQVEVSSEGEGTVTPSGVLEIRFNERLELDIHPSGGCTSEVYVDGVLVENGSEAFTFVVSIFDLSKHSIHVRFVRDIPSVTDRTLKVISNEGGTVSPTGSTTYKSGEVVTITASPSASNVIGDVLIDSISSGSSNLIEVLMDSDHTVEVIFRPISPDDIPVSISVGVDVDIVVGTLGYTEDLDYGIVSPSGSLYVASHGSITVMVTLNPGFEIRDMMIDGVSMGAAPVYTVTDITSPVSMELSIVRIVNGHIIEASSGIGGDISPSGYVKVAEGEDQLFTFSPSPGYKVSHLIIDGRKVTDAESTYTFVDVVSPHSIEVVFSNTGEGGGSGGSSAVLTGIRIIDPPTRTSYTVGESFDPAGMVVEAVYSDGGHIVIGPSQYTLSVDDPLTTSSTVVTVSYQGRNAIQKIVVSPAPTLEGIEINNYPQKVSYALNEAFDPTGMDIIALYDDGSTSVKTTGFTVEGKIFTSYGSDAVTVTYTENGITATCSVHVSILDDGAFTTTVVSYSGTKVSNGSVVSITGCESMSTPLEDFSLDLHGIVPGIKQTIRIELRNNWSSSVSASVFIDDISGSAALADQILLTVEKDGHCTSKRLSEVVEGDLMTVDVVDPGDRMMVSLSLEYMNLPENNSVMDERLDFTIGFKGSASDNR